MKSFRAIQFNGPYNRLGVCCAIVEAVLHLCCMEEYVVWCIFSCQCNIRIIEWIC